MNVVICDGEALVRKGIRRVFESDQEIVVTGEAVCGREAAEKVRQVRPDVLLTEIGLSDGSGFDLVRDLVQDPSTPVAVIAFLAHRMTKDDILRGLQIGVRGFLLKSDSPEEVVAGVWSLYSGHGIFSASAFKLITPALTRTIGCDRHVHPVGLDHLTRREIDVLRFIAMGMSNNEIADSLTVSPATVKSHVSRLLSKLQLRDRGQAIVAAYRIGLVRADDGTDSQTTGVAPALERLSPDEARQSMIHLPAPGARWSPGPAAGWTPHPSVAFR
ncbi:MAG: response regulator transcription factor [Micromonosporaceae bacterium]|nr:response regulator transcription factor [Micromonosporaceae bacterium]